MAKDIDEFLLKLASHMIFWLPAVCIVGIQQIQEGITDKNAITLSLHLSIRSLT